MRSLSSFVAFAPIVVFLILATGCKVPGASDQPVVQVPTTSPFVVVLGIGQDGGVPQTGNHTHPGWTDPDRAERVVSLGLVDPQSGERWMFEATPDLRSQWFTLDTIAGTREQRTPDGIFLTHGHIGHYTGLMFFGHESLGAQDVAVHAMPMMARYLTDNGPWSQLVKYGNIALQPMSADSTVALNERLRVTPVEVPHRQEFTETVGFIIEGPSKRILFIPDIDSWEKWSTSLTDILATVDVAYIDATFYANGEIPGRDMSGFPHPFISHTMDVLAAETVSTKGKIRFIHLNHTNPVLVQDSAERNAVFAAGFGVAEEGEIVGL